MEIQIKIKTPKGQATKVEQKIRFFILGNRIQQIKTIGNKEDDTIIWQINADPRKTNKILRNVALYDTIMEKMLTHKRVKKTINKQLDLEGQEELRNMLINQTTVTVIKGHKPDLKKQEESNKIGKKAA